MSTKEANVAGYVSRYAAWASLMLAMLISRGAIGAEPAIFWASDPVRPGEAVTVIGEGLGQKPAVEIAGLPDAPAGTPSDSALAWPAGGQPVETLQATGQSLKFVVPKDLKPGVWAFRITADGKSALGLLNRPCLWWLQGEPGVTVRPGTALRLFGKNLGEGQKTALPGTAAVSATVHLRGPKSIALPAEAKEFSATVKLPEDLPLGEYHVALHNGRGGAAAWSAPLPLTVANPPAWPQTVFNVKDFGAEGSGVKDDTSSVLSALEKAEENHGGIVYFPRGRYRISDGLVVPRFTVLRGEKRELTALCWTDLEKPPEALVRGANSFGLEELTLYANNYRHVIAGDLGDRPDAGNVLLRRLRVRADIYRGHPTPEQVDARFRESLRHSTGGGDTVRLGGPNIEITGCDLYGSGRSLFLSRVRGGRVSGNRFCNGRWGWYCISGSNGLIFEDNLMAGADLMSTGGGLNCLDGSSSSENVYYAHNRLAMMHGWDREAMTSDAGGEVYYGRLAEVRGTSLTLAGELKDVHREWSGAGVFVLGGKGAGQYRRVTGHQGTTVQIDRPFDVAPDAGSAVSITMFQGHYLLVDNEFTDTGAMQFFGTSIECIVAGNRGTRMQGFRGLGLWYYGYQPSWFCQFLDNEISEGNYYHWNSGTEAMLEVQGAKHPPYDGPMNVAAVLRRNRLLSNAQIRVAGACRDVLVEGNRVEDVDQGIFVSREAANSLVRVNQFRNVGSEVVDEEAMRKAAQERLKRYLGRREPVAVWSFDSLKGTKFLDSSGNGFSAAIQGGVSQTPGGIRGQAARFDGTGFLRVEEPAVFNAPDITVSLWIKPAMVAGRRGLVSKRFAGTGAPFVVSQNGAAIGFEAAQEGGPWSFNFSAPPAVQKDQWTHVAAVVQRGVGVTLYVNGRAVAEKKNAAERAANDEPLILGREAWGGDPPKGDTPGFYQGLMDEVKIWTRALAPEEVQADHAAGQKGG